jgi:SAM-dependent methyltransferase
MSYANPAAYDRFMGRWSARLAPSFLGFAQVKEGQHVLDVGCGTGILSRAVLSSGAAVSVTGIDPLRDYIDFARQAVANPRARFAVGGAESMPFPDKAFDAALALLVLQDSSDPAQAVREMARVTRPGCVIAACLWDFAEGLPMLSLLWEAAEAVAPDAVALQRANLRSQRVSPNNLETLWRDCGLSNIATETLELRMNFSSFDDYWQPFLGGSTPTSAFAAAVNAQTRGALARVLRDKIAGVQPDGSFVMPARAWAIRGTTQQ